jgi:CubicO group peptidase (beta-lactamase class C family)
MVERVETGRQRRLTPASLLLLSIIFFLFNTAGCRAGGGNPPVVEPKRQISKTISDPELQQAEINREMSSLSGWMNSGTPNAVTPCAAAAVVYNGEVIFSHSVRCKSDRQYQVASLTKTFAALAILQLNEKKIIKLDDPVEKYLYVDFRNPKLDSEEITIRQLLTHTSGLVEDIVSYDETRNLPFRIPEQRYPAGMRFNYCNQGYNLLGYLVFEVTGQTLGEYVTKNIIQPLGMIESTAPSTTRGAAGISCSINDLAVYMMLLINEGSYKGVKIVSQNSFGEMLKESLDEPPAKHREYRGISWRVWTIDDKLYSMHHAAHMPGSGGFMQLFPPYKTGYVMISNPPVYDREEYYSYYNGLKRRLLSLSQVIINDEDFKPLRFAPDRPSADQLHLFAGRYYKHDGSGRYVDITLHPRGYLTAQKSFAAGQVVITATSMRIFVYIFPGQTEKGELYDFMLKGGRAVGLGIKDGYYLLEKNPE